MLRPYTRLLGTPGAPLLLFATFAGALPIGMLSLAVLLLVRATTGSLGEASVVAAALTAGNAGGVALQGRLIDRYGQTVVLPAAGLVCTSGVALLAVVATHGGTAFLDGLLALIGGASIPATTSCMRVLWPSLVEDAALRTSGYALLSLMFTVALVLGPLVVSILLVLVGPATAVLSAAGLAGGAAILFASTPSSRRWRSPSAPRDWRPRAGATPGMRTLIVGNLGVGVIGGLVSVAVPAVAIESHAVELAGVLSSLSALGDGVGGLAYGARSWRVPPHRRLPLLQVAFAGICAGQGLARSALQLAPLMLVSGVVSAPIGITASMLLDVVAPEGALTEAYAVMVASGLVGSSIGYALGGNLAHAAGPATVFFAAAGGMAFVSLWTLLRGGTLRAASDP
jgi:MFS family permease